MVHHSNQDATSLCIFRTYIYIYIQYGSICKEFLFNPVFLSRYYNMQSHKIYPHKHIHMLYIYIYVYILIVLAQLSLSRPVFVNPNSLNCIPFCA